jgi:hypothetical protein
MDKRRYNLALFVRLGIRNVKNGNFNPVFRKSFQRWQFELSTEKKLNNLEDIIPNFDEVGNINNATFSKISKFGTPLTERIFIQHLLEKINTFNRGALSQDDKLIISDYQDFLKNKLEYVSVKRKPIPANIKAFILIARGIVERNTTEGIGEVFYFGGEEFTSALSLERRIQKELGIKESFRKFLISTIRRNSNTQNNMYLNKKHLKEVKRISDENGYTLTPYFKNQYEKIVGKPFDKSFTKSIK